MGPRGDFIDSATIVGGALALRILNEVLTALYV